MVCGKPLSQFMLCCVEPTLPTTDLATGWVSTAAIIATVVVLPADPVTPITNGLRDFTTQDDQNDKYGTTTRCIGICLATGESRRRRATTFAAQSGGILGGGRLRPQSPFRDPSASRPEERRVGK